jgi:hypothetical protein
LIQAAGPETFGYTLVRISENPVSVEVSEAAKKLQLALIELQCDSILRSSFNQEAYF